ncbi:uncharacterized protein LOC103315845 [Nasonia vitripennis]|uniref:Uncharacterized protein n=1 Tax=Nasonia vitripennis TaxID=7425 RepID=A0A7M7H2P1_NASVI|nr:uncharacterized protein LOC103315845 [Nasonia vitripennis]
MYQFLYIVVFVLAFTIVNRAEAEKLKINQKNKRTQNLEPQIKLISYKIHSLNEKYATIHSYAIKKENATYNKLQKIMTINRDFPPVIIDVKVYATDKNYENPKLLLHLDVPPCSESRYREFLPKALVVPKSMLQSNCLKKGDLNTDDLGIFRFDALIPKIHEISDYYKVDYNMTTVDDPKEIITEETLLTEWGYLHTQ